MNAARTMVALAIGVAATPNAFARLIPEWSYKRLMEESDLVVVVVPLQSDFTGQKAVEGVPDGFTLHTVLTKFEVKATLKGKAEGTIFVKHYELIIKELEVLEDPPNTISFVKRKRSTKTGIVFPDSKKKEFILFLKKGKNQSFVFVTGAMDPQLSIRALFPPKRD